MNFWDIIYNNWFVSLITGVVSGLLVYKITSFYSKKEENKLHLKDIENANNEVITKLKPYVANNDIPNDTVFSSLIYSVSRKYGVAPRELYSKKVYCEELIADLLNDTYISADSKNNYTQKLTKYIDSIKNENVANINNQRAYIEYMRKRNIMFLALFVGLIATTYSIILLLLLSVKSGEIEVHPEIEGYFSLITPIVIIIVSSGTILMSILIIINMRKIIKGVRDKKTKMIGNLNASTSDKKG